MVYHRPADGDRVSAGGRLHVHHFVHRYPPAVGGAERYVERLGRFLAGHGDTVTVWTSTAVDLEAMTRRGFAELGGCRDLTPRPPLRSGEGERAGGNLCSPPATLHLLPLSEAERGPGGEVTTATANRSLPVAALTNPQVRRYRPLRFPGRRHVLKAASLLPSRRWQCLTRPANPTCPGMWRDVGRHPGPVDAVHAFAFPHTFPAVCGLRLARRHRAAFLLTPFLHLGDPTDPADRTRRQYTAPPLVWLLRQADTVFAQTLAEAEAINTLGVPADRVILQGLGVDPAECTGGDRDAARAVWGVGPGERVVGHLANNSVEKGTVDLLHAVGHMPGVRLVLAGPEMPNFRRAWDRFPHRDRVVRSGVLTDEQKRNFFAGLDVFALPSRSDSFGLVLLEAWANGVPVVCYRAGGPADLVRDGIDGRLVACGDLAGLADAVRQVTPETGDAGRQRVATEFRWDDTLAVVRARLRPPD